jgi:DNA polymerase elongation subunit (family B)
MTPKRLFFDIETSPNIGLFWEAGYKKTIHTDNIIKERAIICICYKWQGSNKTYSLKWDSKQSDKKMLEEFIKVANEAHELVGHNGDRFDLAWIRTRCLFHGIDLFPKYDTLDTLKVARSKFKFNSNRLDYISQFLGFEGKIKTSFGMWKDILLKNDKEAMSKMVEYCCEDVVQLEKVYLKLAPHFENKLHLGMMKGSRKHSCKECGEQEFKISGKRVTAAGYMKVQIQCKGCNKYSTIPGKDLDLY